eukprot:CAMPEP_0204834694 /NCGR_PEP_ID=MMETSP1346-20131115/20462_1 /ASSEMBLY_ACC=CAM_ASM_000771 /TAXON_ID=215587 /ORGANISM="Aplanochytrium stocchinoi, Strain GSBS06" /LENGTH=355 /DNA_ID=CAMNT_0051968153 /DNA_START=106 /DNA_END=1173 /DNA_ORIENTATION=+
MERRRLEAVDADFVGHPERLVVPLETRGRLLFVSQNFSLAFFLRLIWLVVKFYDLAPKPKAGEDSCHNYSTLVSGCNRLAQLLLFTSYTTIVTFWAEVLGQHAWVKLSGQGIGSENESDLSFAISRSTLRRQPGAHIIPITSVNDESEESKIRMQGLLSMFVIRPHTLQILANFWAYATIIILLSVQWFVCKKQVYNVIYQGETISIAFFFGILAVTYFFYGGKLDMALRNSQTSLPAAIVKRLRIYIYILVLVTAIFFPLRAALFLAKPLFGYQFSGLLQKVLYPWFFYPVPEIVPALILLLFTSPIRTTSSSESYAPVSSSTYLLNGEEHRVSQGFGSLETTNDNTVRQSLWL